MPKRSVLVIVLAALAVALALVMVRPGVSSAATPVRIMPLGDSITGSPGCWRALLWNRLQSTGFTDSDFVGTLPVPAGKIVLVGDLTREARATAAEILLVLRADDLMAFLSEFRPRGVGRAG